MAGIEWDDLRYVLAVADARSLAGAARALGVNHTTVLRRVSAFEKRLGLRLFERLATGYVLTAGGEELIAAARHIEDTVTALERKLAGQDLRLSGTVRVTATDTLMASVLPDILAQFRAVHPGIQVEVAVSNLMFNLSKRDADVAIRPAKDPPETLVGRRVAKVAFAIYASPQYASRGRSRICAGSNGSRPTTAWPAPRSPNGCVRNCKTPISRCGPTRSLAMRQAALAGLGLAALPCYLGDTSPGLLCVHPPIAAMETALWILTHDDLRHTARIRAFTEFAANAFARRRAAARRRTGAALSNSCSIHRSLQNAKTQIAARLNTT